MNTKSIEQIKNIINVMPEYKKKRLQLIEHLFIDEIQFLSADGVKFISEFLKHFHSNNTIFGGIKVYMSGDIYQLESVCSKEEKNRYFFEADELNAFWHIKMIKNLRNTEKNERFLHLLDKFR